MTQFYTQWHHLLEALRLKYVAMRTPSSKIPVAVADQSWCNYSKLVDLISSASDFQHYVLTPEVLDLIDGEGGRASLNALHECGIKSMPHDALTIEYDVGVIDRKNYKLRLFVVLVSLEGLARPDIFSPSADAVASVWYLHEGKYLEVPPVYMELTLVKKDGEWGTQVEIVSAPWVNYSSAPKGVLPSLDYWTDVAEDVAAVWGDAQLLLCTKGIGREVVTSPGKLNKKRSEAGKAHIPTHTVIRIGKVYDRSGKEVQHTGRHMRVHWRAGHARSQPVGPGRTGRKLVYIEPVLVNYDPATGIKPANIPHVVTT